MSNAWNLRARARAVLCSVLAGATLAVGSAAYGADDREPVAIPVILPLTGPGAQLGGSERQSFDILERAIDRAGGVRGRPVRFTFTDDQGSPQLAVQLFSSAVANGAHVVFGGAFSGTCKSTAPLADSNKVVFYCLSPGIIPAAGGYVFTAYYYPMDVLVETLAYLRTRGLTTFAMFAGTDASGQEVDTKIDAMLQRPQLAGLRLVAHEHFDPSAVSVSAQMTRIAAARPQAVVVWSATGFQTALRAMHDLGLDVPVALNPASMVYSTMAQFAGVLPSHLYFASGRWATYSSGLPGAPAEIARFLSAFKAAGVAPDVGSNLGWAPGWIVVGALRQLGANADGAHIQAYLENLHGFTGSNGGYDFRSHDQRGLDTRNLVVTKWSPAKNAWVPAPVR